MSAPAARLVAMVVAVALLAIPPPRAEAAGAVGGRFVTTWSGETANLCLFGDVNVTIDWGDGTSQQVAATRVQGPDDPIMHTFQQLLPTHQVVVTGTFDQLECTFDPFAVEGLLSVDEWGATGTTGLSAAFFGARSLQAVAEPPTTVTDMSGMFFSSSFNQPVGDWNVANVTNMSQMFQHSSFNQPIGDWNTANVTDMNLMFAHTPFDQPIGSWDTARVVYMKGMFNGAADFNQDLSGWCVSNISTEPYEFDLGALAWVLPRPQWGTCGGQDVSGPTVVINSATSTDQVRIKGTADDGTAVERVLCAIQDRATGQWLRRDRTWGAYQRLPAHLQYPGAPSTKWLCARRLPAGSFTVKAIAFDTLGHVNAMPRPSIIVRVDS